MTGLLWIVQTYLKQILHTNASLSTINVMLVLMKWIQEYDNDQWKQKKQVGGEEVSKMSNIPIQLV